MSTPGPLRLRGTRAGAAPADLHIGGGPDFLTDPRRACNTDNAHLFFSPDRPGDLDHAQRGIDQANLNQAKKICGRCPFTTECVTYALDTGVRDGVWGTYGMASPAARQRAAEAVGWTAGPKAPTEAELRAQRVAEVAAQRERVETAVRAMWADGRSDSDIALHLGVAPGYINHVRHRLGLATLFGPGGRRIDHELVGA